MEESIEEVVDKWLKLHNDGTFTPRQFREYWRTTVPPIFAPQPNASPLHIEDLDDQAQKLLLEPLHLFIAGSSSPEQIYSSIRDLDNAPALCGHIFKSGEPTYGCRDCGFDPTCVLCSDCFKASPHTKHRYKMSTSSGGGYCDCGDTEAWRSGAFCEVHAKGTQETAQCAHEQLPPDLVSRVQVVIECIVEYAMQMLTHSEGISLPSELELPDAEPTRNPNLYKMRDTFCALLYNDESHTFDQVILALERAIKCTKKEAVAYVTFIDREGRCVIRCNGLQQCLSVRTIMDKHAPHPEGKPFTIKIFRTHVVAHQTFASHLLSWLDKLLEKGNAIKSIFAGVVFSGSAGDNGTRLERIMGMDNELCKASRIKWHKLFISGLLMDLETKKMFARLFAKHYSKMMKAFIVDDHEHAVCIVSLGVQLFTMPTIAHMLIAEEAVIAKLILTFLSECHTCIKNGKLSPLGLNAPSPNPEGMSPTAFKRIQFIFFDLKYLLSMVPSTWSDPLKKGFLHGINQLVRLFTLMQNMDSVTRKEGSHVEFEQEWEGAFNMYIKLAAIIPQLVEWASSDRIVLIKTIRMIARALNDHACDGLQKRFMREAAGHTVSCIDYDVSKNAVSLHIPLTRLCVALSAYLPKYGLDYICEEAPIKDKPSLKELIEPSLRTLVMVAQCKAGMWRRNGISLSNQTYFYRNVRCRQEMFDRDVLALQLGASLMDSNDFLITMLNKFTLMSWQRSDYETTYMWGRDDDNVRQTVILLEEFLHLLLYVLAERYTFGVSDVTQDDITKHEVIHLLCIQNMTHSAINKQLPESPNHETGMEQVIDEVAYFKKSSEDVKGFYELKEKYYDMYNIFFYHYSKEDQSKSEVQHRERCKKRGEEEVICPPPPPPPFTPAFAHILAIFNCEVFRHIVGQLVDRWSDSRRESVSEASVQVLAHLLGVACYEEERNPGFLHEPEQLEQLVHKLASCKKSAAPQLSPLLSWLRNKLHGALHCGESAPPSVGESGEGISDAAAAMDTAAAAQDLDEKQKKANAALARKKRILDRMADMQKNFLKTHKKLFTEENDNIPAEEEPQAEAMEATVTLPSEDMVALGPAQTLPKNTCIQQTCIVCHQDEQLSFSNNSEAGTDGKEGERLLVMGVMVQPSTVLTRRRTVFNPTTQPLYLPADLHRGIHVSSCGHPMHMDCWKLYYTKIVQREQRRTFRLRQSLSFDLERSEYLCPLCESVCNDAVPLLPPPTQPVVAGNVEPQSLSLHPQQWLQGLYTIVDHKNARPMPPPQAPPAEGEVADPPPAVSGTWLPPSLVSVVSELTAASGSPDTAAAFMEVFSSQYNMARPSLLAGADMVMWDLAHSMFRHGLDKNQNPEDERIIGSVLCSVAYTLRCCEEVQRYEDRALLTGLSERQLLALSALTASVAYTPSIVTKKQSAAVLTSACVTALTDLLGRSSTTLLEMDSFSVMVSLVLMLPTLFSTTHATAKGGLQDQYMLQLCLFGQILQLLVTYDCDGLLDPSSESSEEEGEYMDTAENVPYEAPPPETPREFLAEKEGPHSSSESDGLWLQQLFMQCRATVGLPHLEVKPSTLLTYIKDHCLPFLRCCGLFFHLLTGCPAPEELRSSVWVPESEYYCLLRYLGLSTSLSQGLQPFSTMTQKWMSHPGMRKSLRDKSFNGHRVLKVNELTPLNRDYSVLISEVANFVCPSSTVGEKSSMPIICLVCGTIMCCQSYCCQVELANLPRQMVGATAHHAYTCCAGSAVFLRVWDCRVVFRTGRFRGCYQLPPYLDQYGETDVGLRRGNPLYLNSEHYSRLHMMWLQHLIPENVCRILGKMVTHMIIDWQHL